MKTIKELENFLIMNELDLSLVHGTRNDWSISLHLRREGHNIVGRGFSRNLLGAVEEAVADYTMKHKKAGAA